MRRSSFVLAVGLLCGLTSLACKQGLGQRCEQDSDCESGLCQGADMVSAAGGHCTNGDNPIPTFDAAVPSDATTSDATTSDALMSDAAEAGGDGAMSDASEAGSDAPISETGSDAGDASGADGSDAADASSDAPVEAATGG